jgi:hypothetical protein
MAHGSASLEKARNRATWIAGALLKMPGDDEIDYHE